MKKIGILTLSGNYNYGNRLQNYALQEVYKKLGFEVETIWNEINLDTGPKSTFNRNVKNFLKPLFGKTNYDKYTIKRLKTFKKFTDDYITGSNYIIKDDNNIELNQRYDYFSIGSDQVWNYTFKDILRTDFLMFADKEKTIAYAPSFGVSSISDELKSKYMEGLNHIQFLSVREEAGAKIIKELTNREAKVVLDPTLLLSKEDWIKLENKPIDISNKQYILTYFLDSINDTKKQQIETLAQKNNLEIINLSNIYNYDNLKFYTYGPSEFLYLFHHAQLVLTDSFHACAFSVIFDKPFYVFDREGCMKNMNSRLDTLLGTLNLKERKVNSITEISNIFNCDYSKSKEILRKEKIKSLNFVKKSLNIK